MKWYLAGTGVVEVILCESYTDHCSYGTSQPDLIQLGLCKRVEPCLSGELASGLQNQELALGHVFPSRWVRATKDPHRHSKAFHPSYDNLLSLVPSSWKTRAVCHPGTFAACNPGPFG